MKRNGGLVMKNAEYRAHPAIGRSDLFLLSISLTNFL